MIECEFVKQNLLVENYSGSVSVDDIIILKEYEFAHEKYNKGIKILADLRNADFRFDAGKIPELKSFFDSNYGMIEKVKIAFLTEEGKLETYSSFMKALSEENIRVKIKLFNSEKEAYNWLYEHCE